jgi:signal transduction histidine kinase
VLSLRDRASPERLYIWAREHPWLADAVLAAFLAALLLPVSLVTIEPSIPLGWLWLVRLSLVTAHAVLAARRIFPVVSFVVVSASLAVETLAPLTAYRYDSAFLPSAAVFPIALYSLCAHGRPWARPLGLTIGITGAAMLTVRAVRVFPSATATAPGGAAAWAFLFGMLLVVVIASWALARLRQMRLAYFHLVEERARRAESDREERAQVAVREERTRIAREMHDIVAHSLAVIVTQAHGGELVAAKSPQRAAAALNTIAATGRLALADMRRLLGVLRTDAPRPSEKPDLYVGPQPTLAELPQLLERVRAAGMDVRRRDEGVPRPVGTTTELTVYRLVQEALTNALRHAGPGARAELVLAWDSRELTVTVGDDGRAATTPANGDGHGLIGMRERVAVLGGTLTAGPRPQGGFEVCAVVPAVDLTIEDPRIGDQS